MAIPNGKYTLRASPVIGVGGAYATGNGFNEIVTVAAQVPSTIDRQVWNIEAVKGNGGVYTIVLYTNGSTSGGSWSQRDSRPDSPIITSEDIQDEWRIEPFDNGVPNAITIRTSTIYIDWTWYVGTNEENQVVIKVLPIGAPNEDVPYWQYRAHDD